MRYLIVAPQLGFEPSKEIIPGGLLQFGRCVVRALGSSPSLEQLGVWCQVDQLRVESDIERMIRVHASSSLRLDVRCFGGSRKRLASEIFLAGIRRKFDRIMYLLINQSILSFFPWHPPYDVWEIGEELFQPVSWSKRRALHNADRILSISSNTSKVAAEHNPGIMESKVVHLCFEPPLYEPEPVQDPLLDEEYIPSNRRQSVLIVANMHLRLLYKGHQQLIRGWQDVLSACPEAELWIVGDGDGRSLLESQVRSLPPNIQENIIFLGRVSQERLQDLYRQCRLFAMPSKGEGFGLVFVEAARHGIPSIGGKYDSVKEIVVNNQTGLLVEQDPAEVSEACIRLLTNDDLAKKFGDAAKQRYKSNYQFMHFRERLLNALGLEI